MQSVLPQWVQNLSIVFSILGFIVTLYVLYEVKHIKNTFLSRARLPELINDLSKVGAILNNNLGEWSEQRGEALCQIKVAAGLMKSASTMLPKIQKQEVLQIHMKLNKEAQKFLQQSDENAKTTTWDLYSDIQSTIATITQVSKNNKWE